MYYNQQPPQQQPYGVVPQPQQQQYGAPPPSTGMYGGIQQQPMMPPQQQMPPYGTGPAYGGQPPSSYPPSTGYPPQQPYGHGAPPAYGSVAQPPVAQPQPLYPSQIPQFVWVYQASDFSFVPFSQQASDLLEQTYRTNSTGSVQVPVPGAISSQRVIHIDLSRRMFSDDRGNDRFIARIDMALFTTGQLNESSIVSIQQPIKVKKSKKDKKDKDKKKDKKDKHHY